MSEVNMSDVFAEDFFCWRLLHDVARLSDVIAGEVTIRIFL